MRRITSAWAFVELTRPFFLLGAALVYGLGAAIAWSAGAPIDWGRYALGQAIVTLIQMMTHYANEYFDAESDRAIGANRTWFSGGSGVLPAGRLAPGVALRAARITALLALVLITLAIAVEPAMSAIGLLALLGGWFYSAPPIRLAGSGLGELTTSLIVGLLAPLSGVLMQRGPIDARLLAASLPLVLINIAMLIVFELPDFKADQSAGKRTLPVRIGRRRAAELHGVLLISAFVVVWIAVAAGRFDPHIAAWTLIALPLTAWQAASVLWRARRGWRGYGLMTAGSVSLFGLTTMTFLAGFLTG
jgi:1,4-dihydroxy-2-naphthoate polyprenyltransferase